MTTDRRVLEWTWDEQNGWHNWDDDPANPHEEQLIHEIERLRKLLTDTHRQLPGTWGTCRCGWTPTAPSTVHATEEWATASHTRHVQHILDGPTP